MTSITCSLCERPIAYYDAALNRLEIDESRAVDICQDCVDKFLNWQRGIFARMFPTSSMKRMLEKLDK